MSMDAFTKYNEQAEKMFMGPTREYAKLAMAYAEKMIDAQMEAAKTYTEIGMGQARAVLDIKDTKGLQAYAEGQQKIAQDLSERVKGDAEKVVALNQDFVNEARKLVETNVKTASDVASTAASKAASSTRTAAKAK
ncbi:phasin family protein [Spiribacter sp. C176]|uniref:Phasin family protein n=1 Tax=Spiribacter salilacus TaxID=2664894 RepID=A0A6N7QXD4_9GAMM|nr:phasin family protein [Spiribacter salilacus]MRH77324.1 phasin family protein [Spiribacter salilacus]